MTSYSPLVSWLVVIIINLLRTEYGTRAEIHSARQSQLRLHSSSSPSSKLCLRLCKWNIRHQKKRQTITFDECSKNCEQGKAQRVLEKKGNLAVMRFRRQRSITADENRKCHGLVKHSGVPLLGPVATEILNVDYKAHSSEEYHYNVSWKPLDEASFKEHNWTHYSLLYQFKSQHHDPGPSMKCVLVPKNRTSWILKHKPLGSPKSPGNLLSAVVSYPYSGNDVSRIPLHEFDPLKPTFIPTFIPVFATAKASKLNFAGPIAGGSSLALLIVILMVIFLRRRGHCSLRYQDPVRQHVIAIPNNIAEGAAAVNHPPNPERNRNELYYSCYFPENEAFREKVASIVNLFRKKGYNVIMDAMASSEISSQGPTRWAERQIRRANKVLIFLSPGLLKLAVDGCEGMQSQDVNRVWIELEVLRDIYTRNHSAAKMVCIALPDTPVSSLEHPLWAKVSYNWPNDFEKLLRRLNDRPCILPG